MCVCGQASRSRATLSYDSSYFSYWQGTIQASYAVMRQLLLETLKTGYLATRLKFEQRYEKTNILVSDLVRHKLGCTATEDGYRLEISDIEIRGIVLSM